MTQFAHNLAWMAMGAMIALLALEVASWLRDNRAAKIDRECLRWNAARALKANKIAAARLKALLEKRP